MSATARIAVIALLALAVTAGAAALVSFSGDPIRAAQAVSIPSPEPVTGFVIDDSQPVNLPWHTTGWETSAAVCDPALAEVVEDYRDYTNDTLTDAQWAELLSHSTSHCR